MQERYHANRCLLSYEYVTPYLFRAKTVRALKSFQNLESPNNVCSAIILNVIVLTAIRYYRKRKVVTIIFKAVWLNFGIVRTSNILSIGKWTTSSNLNGKKVISIGRNKKKTKKKQLNKKSLPPKIWMKVSVRNNLKIYRIVFKKTEAANDEMR